MNDNPQEDTIEIQDLDEGQLRPRGSRRVTRLTNSVVALYSWTRKHRVVSAFGTFGLVTLTLLILLSVVLPGQRVTGTKGSSPSPIPTPLSGPGLFYFSAHPSWGTVALDGRRLADVPTPLVGDEPPIRLSQGQHVLEWHAPPFTPYSCTLLVPPHNGTYQTCNILKAPATTFADSASLIVIPANLTQLPAGERASLIGVTQSLLDSLHITENVRPGEHYAFEGLQERIQIAQVPLQATLRLFLDTDEHVPATCPGLTLGQGCTITGQDCRLFCTPLWPKTAGAYWNVAVLFHSEWQYTGRNGKTVTSATRVSSLPHEDQFLVLYVTWTKGQWHVNFQNRAASSFNDPLCITTIGQVQTRDIFQQIPGTMVHLTWTYGSSWSSSTGCLAVARVGDTTGTASAQTDDALLLYRFGAMLTANDVAHRLWPTLPVANSHEQQLAQELLQQVVW